MNTATHRIGRRHLLIGAGSLALLGVAGCGSDDEPTATTAALNLTVYKDPTCGCCGLWVEHAKNGGATVQINESDSLDSVFATHQVPVQLQSCHLTLGPKGEVFVGHIPLTIIKSYLASPPEQARGLAVPGMPVGSPGMESGNAFAPYDVFTLGGDNTAVFTHVGSAADQQG